MDVCCVLLGGYLYDGLITRPEKSNRGASLCDQGTLKMRRLKPITGLWKIQQITYLLMIDKV